MLSHGDAATKAHLCRRDTLLSLFEVMHAAEPGLLLKLVKALKHLTAEASVLGMLQVSQLPAGVQSSTVFCTSELTACGL